MKKRKRFMSLGLLTALMLGISSEGIQAYAMTNQSITAESGYRLYADSLTSTSGIIKGDVTELLPDYEISSVILPDGNTSSAEEVNYSITSSGDYTFEIIYETTPEDKQAKVNLNLATLPIQQITEEESITTVTEIEENVYAENTSETQTEAKSIDEVAKEVQEVKKSEKLTLTVTLPSEETTEMIKKQQELQHVPDKTQSVTNDVVTTSRSLSTSENVDISTFSSFGGYDYNSTKTWATSDFKTQWMTASNEHMNYNTDPGIDSVLNDTLQSSNNETYGAMFRFGKKLGTTTDQAFWLQQGSAFSDIRFDFTRDFALLGYMRIGDSFGAPIDSIDSTDIKIDGGVTISFIPESNIETARNNARMAKGAAYRLGAYGTLPNSIILEYDTSTDDYYKTNDWRNFSIGKDSIQNTGDYHYASSGNAFPILNDGDIYDLAIERSGTHYQNISHIGISTTDTSCYVPNSNEASRRMVMGSNNTGLIPYQIQYVASDQIIHFTVQDANGDSDVRSVSMNVSKLLNRLSSSNKQQMRLAFTYGAAYQDVGTFVSSNSGYFSSTGGSGQIDIYANELYVNPDLQASSTKVKWLENGTRVVTDSNTYVAYNNASNYSDRKYWPVAGDRVYAQFNFTPTTNIMPQPTSTQPGKLKLRVSDLKITDNSENVIQGLSINSTPIYIRNNGNSNPSWNTYNSSSAITVSGTGTIDVRVELKLPTLATDSSVTDYYVSGTVYGDYTVGGSSITYQIPLMSENKEKIAVSRNPMFINFNGYSYYDSVRIIKSSENISVLKNITNGGSKDVTNTGDKTSLHYGSGYRPMSTGGDYYPMYQDRSGTGNKEYDLKEVNIQSASMDNLDDINIEDNVMYGQEYSVDKSKDTRYIIEYLVEDGDYSSKDSNLTQNKNRGKSTGKRIIWTGDNVQLKNGLEFYALPVTMTKDDFSGFNPNGNNNAQYYQKIAKEGTARLFRTSNYDFTDLLNGSYDTVSGIGLDGHKKIQLALENPGREVEVPLQISVDGSNVQFTIKLTIADSIPKVVSNVDENSITDETANKIIFGSENYTVSATFKLAEKDGNDINIADFKWNEVQDKINIALYKMNGSGGNDDKFYRWANRNTADHMGMAPGTQNPKLELPAKLTYNGDGTFNVTYTLWDKSDAMPTANWIKKEYEDGAQWKILAWTDTNGDDIKYGDLSDIDTDTLELNYRNVNSPSVTTTIHLIQKDTDGSLPESMFTISDVRLVDDAQNDGQLINKDPNTMISVTRISGADQNAQHDFYYTVEVANTESVLTQKDTGKTINASYLKYNSSSQTYTDVTSNDKTLGKISYNQVTVNSEIIPSSIRFGMKASKPNNLISKTQFIGETSFKFVRYDISGGGTP